jgi:hypothetical protein
MFPFCCVPSIESCQACTRTDPVDGMIELQVLSQRVMEWANEDGSREDSCFRPYPLFTISEIIPVLGSQATIQDAEVVVDHMTQIFSHNVHRNGDV